MALGTRRVSYQPEVKESGDAARVTSKCIHVCGSVWLGECVLHVVSASVCSLLDEWRVRLSPLFSNVWEAVDFLSVFSTPAITRHGNANGCFDSHRPGLKHLFYYVSLQSLESVDFKL